MFGSGWIFLPTTSYIVFTIAAITYMIKFKNSKWEKFLWVFNCIFFLYVVGLHMFDVKNTFLVNTLSSLALIVSFFIFISIGKKDKSNT